MQRQNTVKQMANSPLVTIFTKIGILSSEETMEGVGGNNKANKQFDGELEGAGEPQIFSLAGCRLDLSNM